MSSHRPSAEGHRRQAEQSACPPGGETFAQAQERIWNGVEKIFKRHRGHKVLLVLQPVVASLLKCRVAGEGSSAVWENVTWGGSWSSYDLGGLSLRETRQ